MSVLPLRQAYKFMTEHGVEEIAEGFLYMTGARRGLFITILNEKGLLEQFFDKYWPERHTTAGRRMIQTHLRRYDDYLELNEEVV